MSKIIPLLTFAAGGAAAYAWFRNGGNAEKLEEQVHGAAGKVREVVDGNMNGNAKAHDMMDTVMGKAKVTADRSGDRVDQAVD